jgi:hypothetical protein
MQTQQSPLFGKTELVIVQGSLEPIKWQRVIHLFLNHHDMLNLCCKSLPQKQKQQSPSSCFIQTQHSPTQPMDALERVM